MRNSASNGNRIKTGYCWKTGERSGRHCCEARELVCCYFLSKLKRYPVLKKKRENFFSKANQP